MTPSALTPAARGTRSAPRPKAPATRPAGGRGTGHRAPLSRTVTPRAPRRISGPAAPAAPAAPATPASRPSAPAQRRARRTPRPVAASLPTRCAAYLRALPDHRLLDRVVRGRAWIPLLGVLLAGIVAMQVEVLKLNAGIGRSIEQTTALQTRNQALETAVAQAGDYQRIESAAARLGMAMSAPGAIRFIGDDVQAVLGKALAAIHEPDSTSFAATQAATAAASDPAATLAATTTSEPAATDPATTGDSAAVAATATATGLPSGN